jgi:hypothetical protein
MPIRIVCGMHQEIPQTTSSCDHSWRSPIDREWKCTCFDILPDTEKEVILALQSQIKMAPIFLESRYLKMKQLTRTSSHKGPNNSKEHSYELLELGSEALDYLTLRLAYEVIVISSPHPQARILARLQKRFDALIKEVDDLPGLFMFGPKGFQGLPRKGNIRIYDKIKQAREALTFLRRKALERQKQVPEKNVPVTRLYTCFSVYMPKGRNLPDSRMTEFLSFLEPTLRALKIGISSMEKSALEKARKKKCIPKAYRQD